MAVFQGGKGMQTGIRIGGTDGPNGKLIVQALRVALNEAIRRGQNDVAKSIAANIASLGGANGNSVSGCSFQG